MCEQCLAKTKLYIRLDTNNVEDVEVLPGYYLVQATQDGSWMEKDDWGLVRCNDPDYAWSNTPVIDPCNGLTDEEINSNENEVNRKIFDEAVDDMEESLNYEGSFDHAYFLGEAMRKAGYDPEKHGYRSAAWLCNHLAVFLETATILKDEDGS